MSEQTHLLYSILGSEHTLHARQLCHWGAHWNAWRCKLRKVTSSCCSFFWQAQIIRVWQRCDHCRSYHAWDVGFASHKINSFSSLSTLCLGCLRIVGWLHLKAPLESFPNLSILNQESDYLHTANKKSETNFWRKKWFHSCLCIVERLHLKAPLGSLFLLKAFLGIPL